MYKLRIGFVTETFTELSKCVAEIDWLLARGIVPEMFIKESDEWVTLEKVKPVNI